MPDADLIDTAEALIAAHRGGADTDTITRHIDALDTLVQGARAAQELDKLKADEARLIERLNANRDRAARLAAATGKTRRQRRRTTTTDKEN